VSAKHRVNEGPTGATIAVGEGVDGFELRMGDCGL
jgi:hypothetical protein